MEPLSAPLSALFPRRLSISASRRACQRRPRRAAKRLRLRLRPSARSSCKARCGVSKVRVTCSMNMTGSAKPACISMSPQSCMSVNSCAGAGQPRRAYSARRPRSVSGPRQENITKPSTASACSHWRISACGSATRCSSMLAHTICTLPASGCATVRKAGRAQRAGRHQGRGASPAWPSPAGTPTHSAWAKCAATSACPCMPPWRGDQCAQRLTGRVIHGRRSAMRRATSSCSQGAGPGSAASRAAARASSEGGEEGEEAAVMTKAPARGADAAWHQKQERIYRARKGCRRNEYGEVLL